jgi:hypothetical protein
VNCGGPDLQEKQGERGEKEEEEEYGRKITTQGRRN